MKIFGYLVAAIVVLVGGFMLYIKSLKCDKEVLDIAFNSFECHRMYMSFGLLFGILMVLIISAGLYVFITTDAAKPGDKNAAKEVFDTFSKGLLPIVTLIIGFYFGVGSQKSDVQNHNEGDKQTEPKIDQKDKDVSKNEAADKAAADKAKAKAKGS